jgi:hypothetical protein
LSNFYKIIKKIYIITLTSIRNSNSGGLTINHSHTQLQHYFMRLKPLQAVSLFQILLPPYITATHNALYMFVALTNTTKSGFGDLVVRMLPSGTQVRGFKPGRSRRIFFGRKNPQHAFLQKGSKAVGFVSQICGTLKNPYSYVEVESERQNPVGHFSPELSFFANRGLRSSSSGSGLSHERTARSVEQHGCPLELTVETKHERRTKGPCNKGLSAYGCSRSQANLSFYLSNTTKQQETPAYTE